MDYQNKQSYPFLNANWELLYNQLLFSYYQLAENYRVAVNKTFQLEKQLKKKTQIEELTFKSLSDNSVKVQSKKTQFQELIQIESENQNNINSLKNSEMKKKRIKRKVKSNSMNNYICSYPDCRRSYDSSVSLNFHIKLKHNGGTKKQRQTYAKMILDAQQNNIQPPKVNINFPPGFLQQFKTSYDYMKRYSM